ncbi:hypothetical protein K2173_016425 [Erythroxylum novogranatense]|uniref:Cation/H+ exchanger domain-containing protein n=1 Tax=Erythroxylum novogranatense TaxID=1862640 RepID=A0AAV8SGV2_9ROSI|nr:hypothetical protein K2173_016425 [Erythroxylum novogranatense]
MLMFFQVFDLVAERAWQGPFRFLQDTGMATTNDPVNDFHRIVSRFTLVCRKIRKSHPVGIFYGEDPLMFSSSLIFFEISLVILIIRTIRFLLKPLRQPRIVSEILGGIIIGPSVLGRSRKFTRRVFPDNAQFVVRNVGVLGLMFFLFVAGVKMDISLIRKTGKKHFCCALIGVIIPMLTTGAIGYVLRTHSDRELGRVSGYGAVASNLALTSYPVIYLILRELNLLSSEIGRLSVTTAMIGDVFGISSILVFEALKQAEHSNKAALWYVISSIVLGTFVVTVIRRFMVWVIDKTPEGKPVNQTYVVIILLGVMVMGFLTDLFGIAIANGSLWLGLVIPDGSPLGATVVEKSETIVMELLMAFTYAMVGLYTDVYAMSDYGWSALAPLFYMVMIGYISKIVATLATALYFEIPWKDSLTFSLVMNLRGQVEILLFIHWMDKQIIGIPKFSMLVLLTAFTTGLTTPLISLLYDPTTPYMVNKRRTIQHTPPDAELCVVVCVNGKESVAGLINLLEFSYPTAERPFSIYALRLIELIGCAAPCFVGHDLDAEEPTRRFPDHEAIRHALKLYQEARREYVKLRFFTAATANRTMYQDVCELALETKSALIILPFNKSKLDIVAGTEIVRHGNAVQSLNSKVVAHAPCSVGILVDKGQTSKPNIVGQSFCRTQLKFVVLFLGGADAREALAYAERMILNPDVSIMVIRFLASNNEGDDELEKKLDDGVVTSFWVKNEANERVYYREVVVNNGEETLAAIHALNDNTNDLWIVGRKQGINPVLLQGLSAWSENPELGIIGDYVASYDFGGSASVLVVHQQIMRAQGKPSIDSLATPKCSTLPPWLQCC